MAFYRFSRACREILVNFLRAYLDKNQKHWDGSDWVELPPVTVVDAKEYVARTLPAVVTDSVAGSLQTLSFSNIISSWKDEHAVYGPKDTVYTVYGGRGNFDVTLYCAANDRDLQQKVTDVATVYLTIGRGWVWIYRHILMRDVRLLGDGVDERVPNEPVYYANLAVPVSADWRILVAGETLRQLNFDIELVSPDDPFETPTMQPGVVTPLDKDPLTAVLERSMFRPPEPLQQEPIIKTEHPLHPLVHTPYRRR
jgi:hypothetical protein